ncbi:MAG: Na(+)-translocating NADH-quinone reductase subunit A [Bacteroidaceae bacterium]|nr:Na(+)-translocating NADH-quinone reductase subunit A [Bacteroidaceae bacterium]
MANVIKLRKGLDINLKGKAAEEKATIKSTGLYALVPDDFVGVKPKVIAKEGDDVKVGSVLFVDKKHPEVKFVSPVSGKVSLIERGERRKVLSVQVTAAAQQEYVDFGKKDLAGMKGAEVLATLLETGLFAFFRQRPYDMTPNPEIAPKGIFISAFNSMPLAQDFEFALQGNETDFQTGLDALAKIAPTHLGISTKQTASALTHAKNVTVTAFDGPNPAGNVGVQINHVSPVNKGEVVWTVNSEVVIFIGRLFNTGHVDMTRTVAFAGSEVQSPRYVNMLVGQQLTTLVEGHVSTDKKVRIINGNVLTGSKTCKDGFLAAQATEVTVIPEGDETHELFGWIAPRLNQFSANRSYFSWLFPKKDGYVLDARIKGGHRHMIFSGEYEKVFPMDIYPEQLLKAIITGNIDSMEQLGIYEVAPEDFAVAEFVDSSKVELQRIVREGLNMLCKENE